MMMMLMGNEFQERNNLNINDIDLSLLRLTSPPPYDYSRSFFSAASPPDISPLKRSSPVSDESDQPKRRRISLQDPIFITSPPLSSTYPETSNDHPTQYPYLTASQVHCPQEIPVPENQPSSSESLETERMKMVSNHEETKYDSYEEINGEETKYDTYEEINREETNYDAYEHEEEEEEEEEDCGEGMRIERSGDGFVIRLKCRCRLAYRVLFSDHHLYFKPL
ncbi:Gem-associated-like protein [Hirschfeldia incana]|nr:Gem-associated-like protein [Hirschfeldia incana]